MARLPVTVMCPSARAPPVPARRLAASATKSLRTQNAGSIPDRDRDAFLMHVHADIFTAATHKRVLLSGWFVVSTQTLLQKGVRPFILRLINPDWPMIACSLPDITRPMVDIV